MTRLGQMLVDEGWKQGLAEGFEQGLAQGREQGLAQSREQGLEQGREQGRAEVMQNMLQDDLRIGTAKERILQKLQTYFDLPPADAERYYIQYSQEL